MTSTERELLPCPFCGGDELSHGWSAPGVDGSATTGEVQCHTCDALLWKETEAEAITAWNTRASNTREDALEEQPQLAHPSKGPEPSLRQLVRRYYGEHFAAARADELTAQYIAALNLNPTNPIPGQSGEERA